ncbi:MAG: aminotransferase class V-fold PLP-dependent enzyme [Burkholderiaceae bacterium]|jgi:selenocysteine lyase/cysteine desulfurase|nr:aminotransferase class V-fold PLP-dependent enzyme [Burkholderiaceae bacterium]
MLPSPPLECQKALFALPEGETWLNSAYMGAMPRAVLEAGHRAVDLRALPATVTPADFFAPAERVRGLCAALVRADPEQVALVPTVAAGMAVVAANLSPRAGQNVVVLGDQFPSNVYPWRRWRGQGVTVRSVAAPAGDARDRAGWRRRCAAWHDALEAAIDRDTVLVAVEPAHWTDGTRFDLDRLARRARAAGAAFVVDATQVAGVMPLDVGALRPDALVVHAYKSMLANYGLGFAVFGDRFADGHPTDESWLMRRGSEDFARLVDYQDIYAPGMRRYDTSTRSNPILIGMLEAACRLLVEWQPARIEDYLRRIARPAVERLRADGFGVADEDLRAANLFGIALPPGLAPEAVRQALAARHIHVSVRGAAVRVSPHVCNDEADLLRLAQALADIHRAAT